jgi:hypothetical protein
VLIGLAQASKYLALSTLPAAARRILGENLGGSRSLHDAMRATESNSVQRIEFRGRNKNAKIASRR